MNIFTDKYFSKSKQVAAYAGLDPIVKYRVFGRFNGIAAFKPAAHMIQTLAPMAKVWTLPEGTEFKAKDTVMVIEDHFQNIVEIETMYLQWLALPAYCAAEFKKIKDAAPGKSVMDFHARHLFGWESVALASYGASVGGCTSFSTDIGANAEEALKGMVNFYRQHIGFAGYEKKGIGTEPHALLAIFRGDYEAMAKAYIARYPDEPFTALIDYNNREIDDTLLLLKTIGNKLAGVRTDTCGENHAQIRAGAKPGDETGFAKDRGVTLEGVAAIKEAIKKAGFDAKVFVSSGFGAEKSKRFFDEIGASFDGIGTGSFIPPGIPTMTSDIFEVDGERESKVGREWGYESVTEFMGKAELN